MSVKAEPTLSSSSTMIPNVSTVYGPVESWRVGRSLGIDLIRDRSTCSFNCMYCQLGDIQVKTLERRDFVSTATVLADLEKADWQSCDVITFSGSGEPTLALNFGEVLRAIKGLTGKPVMVLTNGTTIHLPEVQQELMVADQVCVKLDAATEAGLQQVNRPVPGVSLQKIVEGTRAFREIYPGKLALQCMFMPVNRKETEALAALINQIQPDEVQLNTPKRPYPLEWHVDSRGNHTGEAPYKTVALRTVTPQEADEIEDQLAALTGVPILSIYKK